MVEGVPEVFYILSQAEARRLQAPNGAKVLDDGYQPFSAWTNRNTGTPLVTITPTEADIPSAPRKLIL